MDRDLQSIQEVRDLVARAKAAQRQLAEMPQQKLDAIRPKNLGQAGRVSGVSPADVAVLMVYLKQREQ